jgi:hypothetical protein
MTRPVAVRALLLCSAVAAFSCGTSTPGSTSPADARSQDDGATPDAGVEASRPTFTTGNGETIAVGPGPGCGTRFCEAEGDERPAGAAIRYIDPAAEPGGDGTSMRPFRTLPEGLSDAGDVALELRLAPGRFACPGRLSRPVSLVGSGVDETVLEGDTNACVESDGPAFVGLAHLTLSAEKTVVRVRDAERFRMRDVRVQGAVAGAPVAEVGVRIEAVDTSELIRVQVAGHSVAQVVVIDSGFVARSTQLGPGAGPGLLAGSGSDADSPSPATCRDSRSPVCPYAAYIQLEDTEIRAVANRGLEASQSIVRLRRSRIADVSGPAEETIGLHLVQCNITIDTGTVVDSVAGRGLVARSSRGHLQDLHVTRALGGGVDIDRLEPIDAPGNPRVRPFATDERAADTGPLYPEPQIRPPAEWSTFPAAFAGISDYPEPQIHPGGHWFASSGALPDALRADAMVERPDEIDLHRWSRMRLDAPVISDCGAFGLRLAGHASTVFSPLITGTVGADSTAILVSQREVIPIEDPGSSVVALSELHDLEVHDNAGDAVALLRACLHTRQAGQPAPFPNHRMLVSEGTIAHNLGRGVIAVEGTVDVRRLVITANRGIGLWAVGAFATVQDTTIEDTVAGHQIGRGTEFDAGYGLVLQGSDRWSNYSGNALDVAGNSIRGSANAGVVLVLDMAGIGGNVLFDEALVTNNGAFNAVHIGALGDLRTGGDLELRSVTAESVRPPAVPGD